MKKEDNAEGKFVEHEKNGNQETHSELLKNQLKNGILPWKSTEKRMLSSQTNEAGQQSLEARLESVSLISHQEISRPLLLLLEDNAEDFDTELAPFNDLWDTSELVSCNEYLPYYRTYTHILETPENISAGEKHEDTETEEWNQSNGYVFMSKYEDKPLNDMDMVTGYVPYYQSYEEYFGSPDLLSEVHSRAGNEEAEIDSTEEIKSEIDYEVEEIFENEALLEKHKTDKCVSQCSEELIDVLTDYIINPCDSEISVLDEIRSPNPPSSSGYFPYYRTYGHLLLSPAASSNTVCSVAMKMLRSEFDKDMKGDKEANDYNNDYSVS